MTEERIRYPRLHRCVVFGRSGDERFTLLPVGLYCNAGIAKAKPGERIEFRDDLGKSVWVIKRMCRLTVNSPLFTFMCHSIYGHGSFRRLAEGWSAMCMRAGLGGRAAFDDNAVLLVELGEWDKEAYIAGEKTRIEREDALVRAMAKERLLKEREEKREELLRRAREEGVYQHHDIIQ